MSPKRTYYGFTTFQQRKLLFETWEETGKITLACKKAHVSRGLFYYWKARFDEKGYGGLEEFESRAAHKLNKKGIRSVGYEKLTPQMIFCRKNAIF